MEEWLFEKASRMYLEGCIDNLFSDFRRYGKKSAPEDTYTGWKAWIQEIRDGKYDDGDYEQIDEIIKVLKKEKNI